MKLRISAMAIFLLAAASPSWAQSMTAAEVEAEIIGKTVCAETPRGDVCVQHNADGTSKIISGIPEQQGTWQMDGDKHCITWTGAEERCTGFARDGEGYANDNGPISVE